VAIIRVSGGLGNQLFQYSFGRYLEIKNGEETVYDLFEYRFPSNSSTHKLEVSELLCSNSINRPSKLFDLLPDNVKNFLNVKNRASLNVEKVFGHTVIQESAQVFDRTLDVSSKKYYLGNFISHLYWSDYSFEIIQSIKQELEKKSKLKFKMDSTAIGIHIRRGDYISNKKTRKFHGYCSNSYYLSAIHRALELHPEVKRVVIASDSLHLVEGLKQDIEKYGITVEFLKEENPVKALILLAGFEVFIGSNSTFSWWAAALTDKKTSIFPREWFASGTFGYSENTYFPFPVITLPNALNTD
jgi:hypothetical protein